ncbi:MAG: class I SAM-dependent methyltransferase [Gammaproteobacteria bacterium]|nr:class I SAM-dependent methyltransferase [Gammaproteobacteria bacterium]
MTQDSKRIISKHVDLDKNSMLKFFDSRGAQFDEMNPYVSILYQDHDKDLAIIRDHHEKDIITPLLHLNGKQHLLDIGCGVGRWADTALPSLDFYLGLDFSESLIKLALNRFQSQDKTQFIVMDAKNVSQCTLGKYGFFDRIIISGVLIYMNDKEMEQMLRGILELCSKDTLIYIREPLAHEARLTLNEYWSNELNSSYSAIYRTAAEMNHLLADIFGSSGFNVKKFKPLYTDQLLNNRLETSQFFTVFSNTNTEAE